MLKSVIQNVAISSVKMEKSLIDEVYKKLYPLTQVEEAKKKEHIENIKNRYTQSYIIKNTTKSKDKKCPRCGGELMVRVAKKGDFAGNKFYGCSNYPRCRYMQNIEN